MDAVNEVQRTGSASAAISNAVVRLVSEYTGRGPTKAKTNIHRDVITVVLQDTMTKAERMLIERSKGDAVPWMRQQYQRTMRDLVAAVEMIMERRVIAFMSDNHVDPDVAVEVFVLQPEEQPATEPAVA
jgi:uncharacterized protein YbcI